MKKTIDLKQFQLVSTKSASEILNLGERTLEGMRLRGSGPKYVRINNRGIRYRLCDLQEWLESRVEPSTTNDLEV